LRFLSWFYYRFILRENITTDILQGCAVVTVTLLAFIGLVWLREQILHGGGPEWLENEQQQQQQPNQADANDADGHGQHPAGHGEDVQLPAEPAAPEFDDAAAAPDGVDDAAQLDDGDDAGADAGGAADDGQWNPLEWDRAAEELTWERLLGLDGSLVFLEHVFWVVSLNTLFILVFGEAAGSFHRNSVPNACLSAFSLLSVSHRAPHYNRPSLEESNLGGAFRRHDHNALRILRHR
jgi:E3 ubiquitin-protein ligase MARCH6